MKIKHTLCGQAVVVWAILAAGAAGAAETPRWELVVLAGAHYGGLSNPALDRNPRNGAWQVALSRSGPPLDGWRLPQLEPGVHLLDVGGARTVIVREGDDVPFRPGYQFFFPGLAGSGSFASVALSNGTVAFRADSSFPFGPEGAMVGIYTGDGVTPLRRVADNSTEVPGTPSPGYPLQTFTSVGAPSIREGRVVFMGAGGADMSGIYGDLGDGQLTRLVDLTTALPFYASSLGNAAFTSFGTYPSISPTYYGGDAVAFSASVLAGTTLISGVYKWQAVPPDAPVLSVYGDTYDDFPRVSSLLRSPAVDYMGAAAFQLTTPGLAPDGHPASGIYAGRNGVAAMARVGDAVPGEPGATFTDLGPYAALDAAPRQAGTESVEQWLAFVGTSSASGPGVYLRHQLLGQPLTLEKVLDGATLLPLLEARMDVPQPLQLMELSLFHQGVRDGAIALHASVGLADGSGGMMDFVLLARKSPPTLVLAPDADTYVRNDLLVRANDNYGLQDFIEVGTGRADVGQAEGAPDKMRALLHFNVGVLPPLDLNGAVLEASLLSYDNGGPDAVYTVDAHALLGPWSDAGGEGNGYEGERPPGAPAALTDPDTAYGVAWAGREQNPDPGAANNASQPAIDPAVLARQLVRQDGNVAGDVLSWDLTALARGWLGRGAPSPNFGLALTDATGDVFRGLRLGSREGPRYGLPGAVPGPRLALWWNVGVRPGDLNGDDCVDRDDLAILLAVVRGQAVAGPVLAAALDVNGDAGVDIADARKLATLFTHPLGAACP